MGELLAAVLTTGGGTALSLGFAAIAAKIISVVGGPGELGAFSLSRHAYQVALMIGTLGTQTAIVQAVTSREEERQAPLAASILWVMSICSVAIASALTIAAPLLARVIFGESTDNAISQVRWLAVPVLIGTVYQYSLALLNVVGALGRLAVVQAMSTAVMALTAYPVTAWARSGDPAAWSVLLGAPALVGAVSALALLKPYTLFGRVRHELLKRPSIAIAAAYGKLGSAMVLTGLLAMGTQLALRIAIVRQLGYTGAGVFDSAWTLSQVYVLVILASLQAYYLPALIRAPDVRSRQQLIDHTGRLSLIIIVPVIASLIIFKPLLVPLLYTSDFLPAAAIMNWMLLGDYLRITSWVLAVVMLANSDIKTFLWSEIIASSAFFCVATASVILLKWLPGVGCAFMLVYGSYLAFVVRYVAKAPGTLFVLDRQPILRWAAGLAVLAGASWSAWGNTGLRWPSAAFWIICAGVFALTSVTESERSWLSTRVRGWTARRVKQT
jgi:O-antigen/teichoic acid export membrane protein